MYQQVEADISHIEFQMHTDSQTDRCEHSVIGRQTDRRDDSTTAVSSTPSHDAGHDYRAGGIVASDGGSLQEETQFTDGRERVADRTCLHGVFHALEHCDLLSDSSLSGACLQPDQEE